MTSKKVDLFPVIVPTESLLTEPEKSKMNLCLAQRLLVDLVSNCEAAHVQLPENPLEARAEAVESIIHSLKDEMPNLKDAQEELEQKFGIQVESKQHLEKEESNRVRRRQLHVSSRGKEDTKLAQDADGEFAQYQSSSTSNDCRTATLTWSKQPAFKKELNSDETKKAEISRDLIVDDASSDTEEKLPSAAAGTGIQENYGDRVLSSCPDQEMIDLLEDLDEADEGDSGATSDKDEKFGKLHHPNSG